MITTADNTTPKYNQKNQKNTLQFPLNTYGIDGIFSFYGMIAPVTYKALDNNINTKKKKKNLCKQKSDLSMLMDRGGYIIPTTAKQNNAHILLI